MNHARLVLPAIRWRESSGFVAEGPSIAAALDLGVGGFIVFGGTADAVRTLTTELRQRAGRPLLIASDLERGAGQQFEGLTEFPPPRALASMGREDVIAWSAHVTAREARGVGINWVFAPVADLDVLPENPIVQSRAFGMAPADVARSVSTWVRACQDSGALACAKHWPGHGRTAQDSHATLPSVTAPASVLEAEDLVPFRAAISAGVASLMTAHVAYPALDPFGLPATLSPTMLKALRQEGFEGLVVTDALIMDGALQGRSEAQACVAAIAAGCDVLLYPNDPAAVVAALSRAMADDTLSRSRVQEALARYEHAAERAEQPVPPPERVTPFASAGALADALLVRGMWRSTAPSLQEPIELVVVDDDVGGPYPVSPVTAVGETLAALGVRVGSGGSRVVLVFSEPRGWKGRADLGAAALSELEATACDAAAVVLFGHPRLVDQIPGGSPVLGAWHRQRLMQAAVARWIRSRLG